METRQEAQTNEELREEIELLRQNLADYQVREEEQRKNEEVWVSKSVALQNIIESPSAISIVATDLEGNILLWNKGAENMLGYAAEEIIGKKKISVLYPEDGDTPEIVREVVTHLLKEKKGITCEVEELTKDGRRLWVRLTLSPRFDNNGKVVGILGVGENATERKKAEMALAERVTLAAYSAQIGSALAESATLRPILDRCVDITNQFLNTCLSRIWIAYSGEDILEVQSAAFKEIRNEAPIHRTQTGEGAIGYIARTMKPYWTNEVLKDDLLNNEVEWLTSEGVTAFSAHPLIAENRLLGVLEVYSKTPLTEAMHLSLGAAAGEITLGIDRVRNFDALQASEERTRSIVNNSLEGILTFYQNGTLATFNPAAETIFGYTSEEILGKNISQLIPGLCQENGSLKDDLLFGEESLIGQLNEMTGQHKNGHEFPLDLALSELQIPERRKSRRSDKGALPVLLIGMVRDITERKRFEEAIKNERDYTARVIERTPALVVGMSLDGITQFVNPAVERTTGYSSNDLIGKNWWEILFPGDSYQQVEDLFKAQEQSMVRNHELVLTTRAGEKRTVAWSNINRFDAHGNLIEHIGFGTDVTEQKKVERDLIMAARKAEESSRLKSDFLSIISHELRTPLTVMLGSTPLLNDKEDLPIPEEIVNIVRDIDISGKHLLALIDDLLDFSKIEAGKMDLHLESVAIKEFMEQLIPSIQMIARKKDLPIKTEVQDLMVLADKVRLRQIIFNLLSNAIKFTDLGSIRVSVLKEGDRARFIVEDTGCGISGEDLPTVFDVFRQVDASTTRAASGTGLGLAITKKLVALHGGTLTATSTVGQGSAFRFTLPLTS